MLLGHRRRSASRARLRNHRHDLLRRGGVRRERTARSGATVLLIGALLLPERRLGLKGILLWLEWILLLIGILLLVWVWILLRHHAAGLRTGRLRVTGNAALDALRSRSRDDLLQGIESHLSGLAWRRRIAEGLPYWLSLRRESDRRLLLLRLLGEADRKSLHCPLLGELLLWKLLLRHHCRIRIVGIHLLLRLPGGLSALQRLIESLLLRIAFRRHTLGRNALAGCSGEIALPDSVGHR